ncbi:hypothetical protein [Methylobacillus gramineus]|nr:hypothetical protein [Methylobacillus gramineus]
MSKLIQFATSWKVWAIASLVFYAAGFASGWQVRGWKTISQEA